MKNLWIKISVIIIALILGFFAHMITMENDSAIEQAAESILKSQGIDIDFSPDDDIDNE